ncbi:hypothetical protein ACA910_016951 [Epithemia clementina (nom. ined.)]
MEVDNRDSASEIFVVVVESHHHVLRHIHDVLRKKLIASVTGRVDDLDKQKRRDTNNNKAVVTSYAWRMLHFDAHPDLACPNSSIPAAACFRPHQLWPSNTDDTGESSQDLYDMLETTTGIAEWILPLVLAGGLEHVEWVRPTLPPNQNSQLPLGRHSYRVGAWWNEYRSSKEEKMSFEHSFLDLPHDAYVKVDWNCRYYRDDEEDGYVPTEELCLPKQLLLDVTMIADCDPHVSKLAGSSFNSHLPLALDICLDYFVCVNPYLADIEAISSDFAAALTRLVNQATIYRDTEDANCCDHESFVCFRTAMAQVLNDIRDRKLASHDMKLTATLLPFYDSSGILDSAFALLLKALRDLPDASIEELCKLGSEAILYLHLPHFPERGRRTEQIEAALDELDRRFAKEPTEPFMVTLARSYLDGFTPEYVVDRLQHGILDRIHARFCSCGRNTFIPRNHYSNKVKCRLQVVYDYGEWEGSSIQFSKEVVKLSSHKP